MYQPITNGDGDGDSDEEDDEGETSLEIYASSLEAENNQIDEYNIFKHVLSSKINRHCYIINYVLNVKLFFSFW